MNDDFLYRLRVQPRPSFAASLKARLDARRGEPPRERVVQDVEVPLERTADFLRWFVANVPIEPVWLCPVRLRATGPAPGGGTPWPLYPMGPGEDYVNVGFWSAVDIPPGGSYGDTNRAIEAQAFVIAADCRCGSPRSRESAPR